MSITDNTISIDKIVYLVDDFETDLMGVIEANYETLTVQELKEFLNLKVEQSQYIGSVEVKRIK